MSSVVLAAGIAALQDANWTAKNDEAINALEVLAPANLSLNESYSELVTKDAYQFQLDTVLAGHDPTKGAMAAADSIKKNKDQMEWDLDISKIQTLLEKAKSQIKFLSQNEANIFQVAETVKEVIDTLNSLIRRGR